MNNRRLFTLGAFALLALVSLPAPASAAEKTYLIGFRQAAADTDAEVVRQSGGTVSKRFRSNPLMAAKLSEQAAQKLRRHARVAFVEEDKVVAAVDPVPTPYDGEYSAAWSVERIGSRAAHEAGIRGAGVRVAVLDTGIDYNHPDLAPNYKGGENFISPDPSFHDPMDDSWNSHGTHVAGIIAGVRNASGTVGVAPEVSLYAVKVLDGGGFGSISSVVAGLEWAVANGMNVVNISAALDSPSAALEQACRAAHDAGVVVVAAAGNTFGGPVMYPAAYDTVIAVSATDNQDNVIAVSSAGPEVELAAPGGMVYSTLAGGGYGVLTGTSQAAPHVAGVVALALSAGLTDQDGDGALTVRDVRLKLQGSALDLGAPGPDSDSGFGLVQAASVVGTTPPSPPPTEGEPSEIALTLTRENRSARADREQITLAGGAYRMTVTNDGLSAVAVQAFRGETPVHLALYRFGRKSSGTVVFDLDASAGPVEVLLVPFGRLGTSASITATPF